MEEIITLKIHTSDQKQLYKVSFRLADNRMQVSCTCPAGRFGQFCKHKWSLLKGSDYYLYDPDDNDRANHRKISEWAQHTDNLEYIFALSKLEREREEVENKIAVLHSELATLMKNGFSRK